MNGDIIVPYSITLISVKMHAIIFDIIKPSEKLWYKLHALLNIYPSSRPFEWMHFEKSFDTCFICCTDFTFSGCGADCHHAFRPC